MRYAYFGLLLLFLSWSPAFAQETDAGANAVVTLPSQVETVVSGGYWERDGKEGSYRVIILLEGWEHLSNRVFLQWLAVDHEKHDFVSQRIVPIAEINEARWRISEARFELVSDQWRILLPARDPGQERNITFAVIPSADLTYRMGEPK